jgi:hypothetical protein
VDHALEAIYYLKCWLWIAHDRANEFLVMQLGEALIAFVIMVEPHTVCGDANKKWLAAWFITATGSILLSVAVG